MPRATVFRGQCEKCGRVFARRGPIQRFCSRSCAAQQPRPNRRRTPDYVKICRCGNEFRTRVERIRFCSRACAARLGGNIRRLACQQCETAFETKSRWQRYCSPRCSHQARNARTVRLCDECRGEYHSADRRRKYCSRSCASARGRKYRNANSPNWKGGRVVQDGYVRVRAPGHPRTTARNPYVLEHILVMEGMLGRRMERNERVHHRNGRRGDNRPENLELWKMKDPPGVRASDYHCAGCTCDRDGVNLDVE